MVIDPVERAKREMREARRRADRRRAAVLLSGRHHREIRMAAANIGYNRALRHHAEVCKEADPRPGMMTAKQEAAQCSLISAFLDGEDYR